jgi:hypothetical protein
MLMELVSLAHHGQAERRFRRLSAMEDEGFPAPQAGAAAESMAQENG